MDAVISKPYLRGRVLRLAGRRGRSGFLNSYRLRSAQRDNRSYPFTFSDQHYSHLQPSPDFLEEGLE